MSTNNPVLPPGYSAVPSGHVAAVVTSLEMLSRPPQRPAQPFPAGVTLEPLERSIEAYRKLYRVVGTEWLWFSRLVMADEKLQAMLNQIADSITLYGEKLGVRVVRKHIAAFVDAWCEDAGREPMPDARIALCRLDSPAALSDQLTNLLTDRKAAA